MTAVTTRSGPRVRARWIVLLVVVLVVVGYLRFADGSSPILNYRVVDDLTLVVRAQTGPQVWTRVTHLVETPSTVSVTIGSLGLPFVASTAPR